MWVEGRGTRTIWYQNNAVRKGRACLKKPTATNDVVREGVAKRSVRVGPWGGAGWCVSQPSHRLGDGVRRRKAWDSNVSSQGTCAVRWRRDCLQNSDDTNGCGKRVCGTKAIWTQKMWREAEGVSPGTPPKQRLWEGVCGTKAI